MKRIKEQAKLLEKTTQTSDGKKLTPELAKTIEQTLEAKAKIEELKEKYRFKE